MTIAKKTIQTLTGTIVPLLIALITVPVVLKSLGVDGLGDLSIFYAIMTILSIYEGGILRVTSFSSASLDEFRFSNIQKAFFSTLLISSIVLLISIILYFFAIELSYKSINIELIWIAGLGAVGALLNALCIGIMHGKDDFKYAAYASAGSNIILLLVPIVCIKLKIHDIVFICLSIAIIRLSNAILLIIYTGMREDAIRHSSEKLQFKEIREYLISIINTGTAIAINPLINSIDRIILGLRSSISEVTYYSIAFNISYRLKLIPQSYIQVISPKIRNISNENIVNVLNGMSLLMFVTCSVSTLAIYPFLKAWVGEDFAIKVFPVSLVIIHGILFQAYVLILANKLQSEKRENISLIVSIFSAMIFIICAFMFGKYGALAIALMWATRQFIEAITYSSILKINNSLKVFLLYSLALAAIQMLAANGHIFFAFIMFMAILVSKSKYLYLNIMALVNHEN